MVPALNTTGTIAYRLRIGVTGHRCLPTDDAFVARVSEALDRVRRMAPPRPATPVYLAVCSALAEGADRLVASLVLEDRHACLEVVLPMPIAAYKSDFQTEESNRAFDQLMERATRVVELPAAETRDEAYEQAGRYVVERCDVLIALWDGNPARGQGGTADVVEWARDRQIPLLWVHTVAPYALTVDRRAAMSTASYEGLDRHNRARLPHEEFERDVRQHVERFHTQATRNGLEHSALQPYCDWLIPTFVRADLLATRYQKRFFLFSDAIFILAALAVVASAGTELASHAPSFVSGQILSRVRPLPLVEFTAMLLVLVVLQLVRRQAFHRDWISHRVMAERLRSALFLALVRLDIGDERGVESVSLHQAADEWLERAYEEVWNQRPPPDTSISVAILRRFLAKAWIEDQVSYQRKKSHRHEWNHQLISNITVAIFLTTLIIAGMDAIGAISDSAHDAPLWTTTVLYLSVTLPAVASALGGIGAQREHTRNAHRSGQMARYLTSLEQRMEVATDLPTIHSVARQAEAVMLQEIDDWFVTMEYRDVELQG